MQHLTVAVETETMIATILTDIRYTFNKFNKFQDYILNTPTVNRTFLTVMLLFNIFSLQFTAMFPLFYKSAGTRRIKFFICTCRTFRTKCCKTSSSFINLMFPQVICYVIQINENYLELNLDCMANAVAVSSPALPLSKLSNGPIAWWGTAILKNDTFLQQTWSTAENCWS